MKKIYKSILLSGSFLILSQNGFSTEYTNIDTKTAEIKVTTPLSGLIIGAGYALTNENLSKRIADNLNDGNNLALEQANTELSLKMKNFKEKINKYLMANTLKQKIYFKTGQYSIIERERDYLKTIVKSINEVENLKVKLVGYADPRGDEKYNYELSKNRTKSVSSLLKSLGVEDKNIEEYYKGERGTTDGRNNEDFFFDRLVEVYLYK